MKPIQYLNGVLTIIAGCLLIITLSIVGLIPTASAKNSSQKFVSVPLNSDGSINVKLINNTVDVNIDEIDGIDVNSKPLPVEIEK
ncbi:MAG TPA: hypothetical protein VHZ50_08925 [Puia sp.]|nr:hypothetical protein [Puia sp.]